MISDHHLLPIVNIYKGHLNLYKKNRWIGIAMEVVPNETKRMLDGR